MDKENLWEVCEHILIGSTNEALLRHDKIIAVQTEKSLQPHLSINKMVKLIQICSYDFAQLRLFSYNLEN